MTKIDQVARAIYKADGGYDPSDSFWAREGDRYRDIARDAIEALRVPSEAMMDAGFGDDAGGGFSGSPEGIWQAMIDAALNECVE